MGLETQPQQNGRCSSGLLNAVLGGIIPQEILPTVAGGLAGAALGGVGLLLLLGATVLVPLAWRVPATAVLGGAGLVGCLLRSRTYRWSIVSAALHVAGGHRGPTHSLLFLGLATAVGLLLRATLAWWALPLGVLSHLLLDTLTWGGVPWLWPWPKHFRARWALHTGAWVENGVVFPLLLIAATVEGFAMWPGDDCANTALLTRGFAGWAGILAPSL